MNKEFKSGFVTIVGKPNVGKSTLMNAFIGEKVAIVSNKPQTTRNKILGVFSQENSQIVFVDTPGIHTAKTKLGEFMAKSVNDAMKGMDVLLVLVEPGYITEKDIEIAENMAKSNCPKILVINKVDTVKKEKVLSVMDQFKQYNFDVMVPISAKNAEGLNVLQNTIENFLPAGPQYFPSDMITDQPERLICAEIIREKALLNLKDEIPHGIGIEIMKIETLRDDLVQIDANVYCEKNSHKSIIIGKAGTMLGKIGKEARIDIENLLGNHVNLKLWVKVKEDWRNQPLELLNLGYNNKN
ncbi:MAG: GTPase Era [Eubacteriales bacterium]|nr:GTPase Era [Eubacteriales bacterium]